MWDVFIRDRLVLSSLLYGILVGDSPKPEDNKLAGHAGGGELD